VRIERQAGAGLLKEEDHVAAGLQKASVHHTETVVAGIVRNMNIASSGQSD
jgi:hypothetical protein